MFCTSCHFDLRDLPTPKCPECGHSFDPNDHTTFLRTLPLPLTVRQQCVRICVILVLGGLVALLVQFVAAASQSGH